ncbi:MAG: putative autotransporter protein, partial [Verrucomicrobiaceae bacterium]|nr:putative autotransporter protein [Verrucomicrobiaceae bacterium]
ALTVTNAVTANSTLYFGPAANALTLSGAITFGVATPTITVENPNVTDTLSNATGFAGSTLTGFTKAGNGVLAISATTSNSRLTGTITVNSGTLRADSQYALGGSNYTAGPAITLAGGAYTQNVNNVYVLNPVNVTGDAYINAAQANSMIGAVTVTTPRSIGFGGGNTTNIAGDLTLSGSGATTIFTTNNALVSGSLKGATATTLTKVGTGTMFVAGTGSSFTGNILVEQGTLASTSGGTPFGTGNFTVNSAGILRLAAPGNVQGAATVTVNSDNAGLGVLALAYNGAAPASTTFASTNANFGGILAVDSVGFSTGIDLTAYGAANVMLGSTLGGNYTASTLTTTGTAYPLGGGGGTLNFNSAVLSGGNSVVIGATGPVNGVALINNTGTIALNTPNTYSGGTTLNGGVALQVGNNGALGAGTISFHNGTLQPDAAGLPLLLTPRTVSNPINFTGSTTGSFLADAFFGGSTDLILAGTVNLGGATSRVLNVGSTARRLIINGQITGASTGLTLSGGGVLQLNNGSNSYGGSTTLISGTLLVGAAGAVPPASTVIFGGGTFGAWDASSTVSNNMVLSGNAIFDVGQSITLTQTGIISGSSNVGTLTKVGLGTLILSGTNTFGPVTGGVASAITINAGVISLSNDASLGNPNATVFGNSVVPPGGITFGNTGHLLVTDNVTTNRIFTIPNTAAQTGTISVAAGKTYTINGATPTSLGTLVIAGSGTVIMNGGANAAANLHDNTAINGGATLMTQATSGTPFGDTIVTINGGSLEVNTNGPGASFTVPTVNYGGGAYLRLDAQAGNDIQFTATTLARTGVGTLNIAPGANGSLGNTSDSDARVLSTTVLGQATTTTIGLQTLNNIGSLGSSSGVIGASIVRLASATNTNADFVSYDPALGFISGQPTFPLTNTFTGSTSSSVVSITTPTVATGSVILNGLKTTAGISGGVLNIRSLTNLDQGGLLINGFGQAAPVISSGVVFNPLVATGATATSGEGLVYVSGGYTSGTATVSGSVLANGLTKFGPGTL